MIETLMNFAIHIIETFGYIGVFGAMLAQGVGIPIPSEATMLLSGVLAGEGKFLLPVVILLGVLGDVMGAVVVYFVFRDGGRPLLEKYGKYALIHVEDIHTAEAWFKKYGPITLLIGKMLPAVRAIVVYPAAIGRMDIKQFIGFTALGSLVWCSMLAFLGLKLKDNWNIVIHYLDKFKIAVFIFVGLFLIWYIRRHLLRKHA